MCHAIRAQLILADKYERYEMTYEGCHVFNPGRFVGDAFEWSTYYPATQRSERRCVLLSSRLIFGRKRCRLLRSADALASVGFCPFASVSVYSVLPDEE